MALDDWQAELRRDFGREQKFKIENTGEHPVFSDFNVTNPATKNTYRVAIRGAARGSNFCSCPDFAVNTLGTCKHVEFLLAKLGRNRQQRAVLAAGFHPPYSEIYLHYGLKREAVWRAGTDVPAAVKRVSSWIFGRDGILKAEACEKLDALMRTSAECRHEIRYYDDARAFVAQLRDRASLAERIATAFPRGPDSAAFARLLRVPLHGYQREGALFLAKAGRALLADDMGLGKTIQAIAAVEILARTAGVERVLVVAPTSLKHQWKQEIEKFTARSAVAIEGLSAARSAKYALDGFFKIVNYDVLHRDYDAIVKWAPDVIILDEAQRIKNWKTRAAQTVKRLPSQYAFVLTGTPLENRLEELHSIVEFVDRFHLGPAFRFLYEHQQTDDHGRVVGYRNLSKIAATLSTVMLRRTKNQVLKELPERIEKYHFVRMTSEQQDIHDENKEIVAKIVHKWRAHRFLSEADQLRMRVALQYMRMCCNSTYLCEPSADHGVKAAEIEELIAEMHEREMKTVVFSQWVRSHELLAKRLARRRIGFVLFHGGVPGPRRRELIAQFKDDPKCRVFLSTDAGGVGLNLQHASAVINMDQPWNPAVLEQRIGRVHRMGQRQPVHVSHFVSEGTIEHSMLNLLKFKKSLFAGVLDGGSDQVSLGGSRLTKFMESVETATQAIPPPPAPAEAQNSKDDGALAAPDSSRLDEQSAALSALIKAGREFFNSLELAAASPRSANSGLIVRDAETGKDYLKVPLPAPETLQQFALLLNHVASAAGIRK